MRTARPSENQDQPKRPSAAAKARAGARAIRSPERTANPSATSPTASNPLPGTSAASAIKNAGMGLADVAKGTERVVRRSPALSARAFRSTRTPTPRQNPTSSPACSTSNRPEPTLRKC